MLMGPGSSSGVKRFSNLELRRSAFPTYELRRVDRMQADFELIERPVQATMSRSGNLCRFTEALFWAISS
jgi:hypothetical protein